MNVQIPTKLRRNAPCHCGSGHKYKKCCEQKELKAMEEEKIIVTPHSLKNEYRDEVQKAQKVIDEVRDPYAGIPVHELVTRDTVVLLIELRFRKEAIEADHAHFEAAIERGKDVRNAIMTLPKSPYKEAVLADIDAQIQGQIEKAKTIRLPMSLNLTLLALEQLFEQTTVTEEETKGEPIPQGWENSISDALESTGKITVDDAEDELTIPDETEDLDEDDPNEVI